MKEVQQFLFPEMNDNIERARDQVLEAPATASAHENFIRDIQAAIAKTPAGGVVAVGCSAVANQQEIIEAILKPSRPDAAQPQRLVTAEIVMPPFYSGSNEQCRVLFDRYSASIASLNLAYRFGQLLSDRGCLPPPSSRSECVISTLADHEIRLVFLTDAHNIECAAKKLSETDRMIRLLSDIASRSGTTHVLIGEMASLWNAVSRSRIVSEIQMVIQPMYDPEVRADHFQFLAMLKRQQENLSKCTSMNLSQHYCDIMVRSAGDYSRVALWLADALGEAGRRGSANLEWRHLKSTAPRLEQTNDAVRALHAFREFRASNAFEFCETVAAPAEDRPEKKPRRKPFEPLPRRDVVGDTEAESAA